MLEVSSSEFSNEEKARVLLTTATELLAEVGLKCTVTVEEAVEEAAQYQYQPVYSEPHMASDGKLKVWSDSGFTAYKINTPEPAIHLLPVEK